MFYILSCNVAKNKELIVFYYFEVRLKKKWINKEKKKKIQTLTSSEWRRQTTDCDKLNPSW